MQDNGKVTMNGCMKKKDLVTFEKFSAFSRNHSRHIQKSMPALNLLGYGGSLFEVIFSVVHVTIEVQSTLIISKSKGPSETLEISVLRHIRFAELRKIPIEQPNFTN